MTAIDKQRVRELAREAGFELSGVAPALPLADDVRRYEQWLAGGYQGEMHWMRLTRVLRADPRALWPPARSILMLGLSYLTIDPQRPRQQREDGRSREWQLARYALGRDYHKVCRKLARQLIRAVEAEAGHALQCRVCVDSAPLLERTYAAAAGLGWIGKNTCLIHPRYGSYFFLTAILWDLELEPDAPLPDFCGKCRACLDACPTAAFPAPRVLDARRCISYHTIELRGEIPQEYHVAIGNRVFGCDVCQEVCPFNRRALLSSQPDFHERAAYQKLTLEDLAALTREEFEELFQGSPVRRAKYEGFMRNLKIAQKTTVDSC